MLKDFPLSSFSQCGIISSTKVRLQLIFKDLFSKSCCQVTAVRGGQDLSARLLHSALQWTRHSLLCVGWRPSRGRQTGPAGVEVTLINSSKPSIFKTNHSLKQFHLPAHWRQIFVICHSANLISPQPHKYAPPTAAVCRCTAPSSGGIPSDT